MPKLMALAELAKLLNLCIITIRRIVIYGKKTSKTQKMALLGGVFGAFCGGGCDRVFGME